MWRFRLKGFVLREYENAAEIRIDAIGERDVDDAIESAKRNGRLGAVASQGPQPFALASGKKYNDGIAHIGHWLPRAANGEAAHSSKISREKDKRGGGGSLGGRSCEEGGSARARR